MLKTKRPNSFDDAYRLLDDALAIQSPPDLGSLVKNEIRFFKALAADETREVGVMVNDLAALGIGHAAQIANTIEADIRENPAFYLGVVALGAVAFGILTAPRSAQARRTSVKARQVPRRKRTQIRGASK